MTILDALKGLYAKLGGQKSADNIQTIGEALEDITTVTVNGSDALPAVTAVDNGDVLTVVEGAWAKAAPSGGVFTIELSYDEGTSTTVMNKTVQEIIEAANSGKMLWVYDTSVDSVHTGYISFVDHSSNSYSVCVAIGSTTIHISEEEAYDIVPLYIFVAESLTDYPSNAEY